MIHPKGNKIGKWVYGDYKISLYHSNSSFHAKVKNGKGSRLQLPLSFGVLGTCPHADFNWISSSAQNILKDTIAVFPYLKGELTEIWVFEAISSAAPSIYKARKTLKKEPSMEGFKKALRYLEIALKIQQYNQGKTKDLEKAILTTKKEFFLFQIEEYTKYLSSEDEMNIFRTTVKSATHNENIFEQFLGLAKDWDDEDSPSYINLLKSVSCEFLDQPLLAAKSYAHLAEKVSNSPECARSCLEKALSFFDKKNISYFHFLEQLNKEILIGLGLEEMLFEKDAIRMSFEKALITLGKQSQQTNKPTCFICYNPQESDVLSWVHRVLVPDLKKMHICPISLEDLSSVEDYNNFQKNISEAERVIIVCTPELKKKCEQQPLIGVAQQIRVAEQRYENEMGATISLIYFKGDRPSSCPSRFFESIFANQYSKLDQPKQKNAFNYYDMIFELIAPIKGISNQIALEIKELFRKEVQKVLNNQIDQKEIEEWRKIDKKIAISTIKDLVEMYGEIERTLTIEQKIEADLRKHYTSKAHITLLVSQKQMPIETLYTRLAIIGEVEKKAKKEAMEKEKPGQSLEDRRPFTHESIFEPKQAIELEKLFDHHLLREKDKRILIQGSAGIGKSTLCHYIAYRWGKKELFKEFDYLFWLPLRKLNRRIYSQDTTIENYIGNECGLENPQAFFKKTALREKTLIVLDGYDELSPDTNTDECFHPILVELKNFPHVIITSRPQRVDFTNNCELEILGFDNQGIKEYVHHFFPKDQEVKAKKLKDHLQDLLIGSLAHIPINLEIFCSLAAAGESLFTSSESPTMTAIYIGLTDWLFKRFRIDRNHEKIATVIEESDAHEAYDVEPLVEVLKRLAWEAMEKNTIYLPADRITNICRLVGKKRNLKLDLESIRSVGPLKIEGGQGVFIHLTFQEYFAAVYLAHSYQNTTAEAKKLLEEIKFEPRYRLVLCMAAGFLSQKAKPEVLSVFFEDLFSQPRDLAKSYELCLFAQCFEECLHPEKISHYQQFVETAAEYIKTAPMQSMNFELLNRNRKLLHHSLIIETILEEMQEKRDQEAVIGLLGDLAREKISLPDTIRKMLHKLVCDKSLQWDVIKALGEIAQSGQIGAQEAQSALVNAVSDSSLDLGARGEAMEALGRIAQSGQIVFEEAQSVLVKAMSDSFNAYNRGKAMKALGRIAQSGQIVSEEAQSALVKVVSDSSLGSYVRGEAMEALGRIAQSGQIVSQEAQSALVKAVSDYSLGSYVGMIVKALRKIAQSGQIVSQEAQSVLVKAVSDSSLDWYVRGKARKVLGRIARSKQIVSQEAQSALAKVMSDSSLDSGVREAAMEALERIAQSGQIVSEEAQSALVKVVSDSSLINRGVRGKAMEALVTIAQSGQVVSEEAQSALVKVVSDSSLINRGVRGKAMEALVTIAQSGQVVSEEAQSALVKVVSDSSLHSGFREGALEALVTIAQSGQVVSEEAQSALVKVVSDSSLHSAFRGKAVNDLGRIVGHLARTIINEDSYHLVLEICYLTQRALVISENQICISDRRYRESVPIQDIDIHIKLLKKIGAQRNKHGTANSLIVTV